MNNDDFQAEKLEKETWEDEQLDFMERHPYLNEETVKYIKDHLLLNIRVKRFNLSYLDAESHNWWKKFESFINQHL